MNFIPSSEKSGICPRFAVLKRQLLLLRKPTPNEGGCSTCPKRPNHRLLKRIQCTFQFPARLGLPVGVLAGALDGRRSGRGEFDWVAVDHRVRARQCVFRFFRYNTANVRSPQLVSDQSDSERHLGSMLAVGILACFKRPRQWLLNLRKPKLRRTHAYTSDQPGADYPLKYYLEAINDSRKCMAVRVSEFRPLMITLQEFVPDTVQAMMPDGWHPRPNTTDAVALLRNQRCRVWIGIDATKFSRGQIDSLEGRIGTLTLTANGKKIDFPL